MGSGQSFGIEDFAVCRHMSALFPEGFISIPGSQTSFTIALGLFDRHGNVTFTMYDIGCVFHPSLADGLFWRQIVNGLDFATGQGPGQGRHCHCKGILADLVDDFPAFDGRLGNVERCPDGPCGDSIRCRRKTTCKEKQAAIDCANGTVH